MSDGSQAWGNELAKIRQRLHALETAPRAPLTEQIIDQQVDIQALASPDNFFVPAGLFESANAGATGGGVSWSLDPDVDGTISAYFRVPDSWVTFDVYYLWRAVVANGDVVFELEMRAPTEGATFLGSPLIASTVTPGIVATPTGVDEFNLTLIVSGVERDPNGNAIAHHVFAGRNGDDGADTDTGSATFNGMYLQRTDDPLDE